MKVTPVVDRTVYKKSSQIFPVGVSKNAHAVLSTGEMLCATTPLQTLVEHCPPNTPNHGSYDDPLLRSAFPSRLGLFSFQRRASRTCRCILTLCMCSFQLYPMKKNLKTHDSLGIITQTELFTEMQPKFIQLFYAYWRQDKSTQFFQILSNGLLNQNIACIFIIVLNV